jgi:hypothetical protein
LTVSASLSIKRRCASRVEASAGVWLVVVRGEGRGEEKVGIRYEVRVYCGVVVNGVEPDQPHCYTVDECVKQILEEYRREVKRRSKPPPPDPAEELLKEWPELQAFGVEWVRKWLVLRDRLIEIAKVMRKFPWMVDVVKQRPMSILHPYMVEVYVARDGSEACLSLNPPQAFCAQDGAVKETRLELEFSRYETYKEKIREVYRPKGAISVHHLNKGIREATLAFSETADAV